MYSEFCQLYFWRGQQQSQDIKTLSWTWVTTFQEEVSLKSHVTFSTSFVLIRKVSMSRSVLQRNLKFPKTNLISWWPPQYYFQFMQTFNILSKEKCVLCPAPPPERKVRLMTRTEKNQRRGQVRQQRVRAQEGRGGESRVFPAHPALRDWLWLCPGLLSSSQHSDHRQHASATRKWHRWRTEEGAYHGKETESLPCEHNSTSESFHQEC